MIQFSASKTLLFTAISFGALCAGAWSAQADEYVQTDLVSDISGLAGITDLDLANPWGISHSATSPFWISDQGTNTSTLYTVTDGTDVTKVDINPPSGFVAIPTTASGPQGPTGQVNNANTSSFLVGNGGNGGSAHFIFANLNGTISAWDTGATAFIQPNATLPGAVYTGLAINQNDTLLYAANGGATPGIDVFNSSFVQLSTPGEFEDPNLPAGYVPFNVQDIGGKVYVTYAPAGQAAPAAATAGMGFVDVYGENGVLQQRLVSGGALAAPWGVALAPMSFGKLGGDLLVGNFSSVDSEINAYDPVTGAWEGMIPIDPGAGQTPGGLWALDFGVGGSNGSPNILYFTDGIDSQMGGLFGAIASVPEFSTWAMMLAGFGGLGLVALRRRRSPLTID